MMAMFAPPKSVFSLPLWGLPGGGNVLKGVRVELRSRWGREQGRGRSGGVQACESCQPVVIAANPCLGFTARLATCPCEREPAVLDHGYSVDRREAKAFVIASAVGARTRARGKQIASSKEAVNGLPRARHVPWQGVTPPRPCQNRRAWGRLTL